MVTSIKLTLVNKAWVKEQRIKALQKDKKFNLTELVNKFISFYIKSLLEDEKENGKN